MTKDIKKLNSNVLYEPLESTRWSTYVPPKAKRHLENSMRALKSAHAGVPTIPLYGKTDSSIVDYYYSESQRQGNVYPQWQLEYELARKSKFGEQGGRSPWDVLKPSAEAYVLALEPCTMPVIPETVSKYKSLRLQRCSLRDALNAQKAQDKIQSTANGWSRFDLKKDDPVAQDIAINQAKTGKWRVSYAYFFSYIRKMKNRIFVPAPFSVNLLQATYHDVLLKAIQEDLRLKGAESEFRFFGDKIGFQNLWPIMQTVGQKAKLKTSNVVWVVRDFKAMDTTMGEDQKRKHYCPKIAAAFNLGGKAKAEMEEIICFSNRMPIATPDGVIVNDLKGEASGATVTNQGESCDNEDYDFVLTKRILERCVREGIKVRYIDSYGNGDDGISRFELANISDFDRFNAIVEEEADIVCQLFGHAKNEKWHVSMKYGVYCQYEVYHDSEGKLHADYPVSLMLNSIMHPMHEIPREKWDSDFIDWRAAEILTHGVGRDDFKFSIDFVDNGMKRGLFGRTKEDFIRIFSKYEKYRALRSVEDKFNLEKQEWLEHPELNPVIMYIMHKRGLTLSELQR